MISPTLVRLAAFTADAAGGNPAGVWIGDRLPTPARMQRIAIDVGYSETAFLAATADPTRWTTRYYSPRIEVDFCGHATIAAAVALGHRHGDRTYRLDTRAGQIPVEVRHDSGRVVATLTSVEPQHDDIDAEVLDAVLAALNWSYGDLDPILRPGLAYAGTWHLVVPVASRTILRSLSYDFDALEQVMRTAALTTVQIVWGERDELFHARNPFPVGGVIEDPATGAAAAAFGGYLRHHGHLATPADIVIIQGVDMGRPSRIDVHVPASGGIRVTGSAIDIGT